MQLGAPEAWQQEGCTAAQHSFVTMAPYGVLWAHVVGAVKSAVVKSIVPDWSRPARLGKCCYGHKRGLETGGSCTGPPGCGKSAVLGVLARELGFELCEWRAPVPTLWDDHLYQACRHKPSNTHNPLPPPGGHGASLRAL